MQLYPDCSLLLDKLELSKPVYKKMGTKESIAAAAAAIAPQNSHNMHQLELIALSGEA